MNVRVHYPSTKEGLESLKERMVDAHANAIINYIDNLPYSYEQRARILKRASEGPLINPRGDIE